MLVNTRNCRAAVGPRCEWRKKRGRPWAENGSKRRTRREEDEEEDDDDDDEEEEEEDEREPTPVARAVYDMVGGRSFAGIAGSNPAGDLDVYLL